MHDCTGSVLLDNNISQLAPGNSLRGTNPWELLLRLRADHPQILKVGHAWSANCSSVILYPAWSFHLWVLKDTDIHTLIKALLWLPEWAIWPTHSLYRVFCLAKTWGSACYNVLAVEVNWILGNWNGTTACLECAACTIWNRTLWCSLCWWPVFILIPKLCLKSGYEPIVPRLWRVESC